MANAKWVVDPAHSSIDFTLRHMMVSRVKGTFHNFEPTIEADPNDLTTANILFKVEAASIDTGNDTRDNHVRSADFFDAENHPYVTFQSTNIVKKGNNEYDLTGNLTIRETTRPETFHVTYEGSAKNPYGQTVAGFIAEGAIDRTNYGLTYNAALETGGVLIGNEIKLSIGIEATKEE